MTKNLTPAQTRVLALITEHGTIVRNWGGGGTPKGFNITAAESLAKKGLVVITEDAANRTHVFTLDPRVADMEEAHTAALEEDNYRVIAQALPVEVAAAAETNPEYAPAQFLAEPVTETELAGYVEMWEAIPMAPGHEAPAQSQRETWLQREARLAQEAVEDGELEALTSSEAARFETTGELPAYKTERQAKDIRRAFERRGACPWTNVMCTNATGPCQRWAGHPGGCVIEPMPVQGARVFAERGVFYRDGGVSGARAAADAQRREAEAAALLEAGTPSVPAGGFPSPYAVATLIRLTQGSGQWVPSRGDMAEVEELEGRGFVVKIPGLALRCLTDAGREFTREHVLSAPARS